MHSGESMSGFACTEERLASPGNGNFVTTRPNSGGTENCQLVARAQADHAQSLRDDGEDSTCRGGLS